MSEMSCPRRFVGKVGWWADSTLAETSKKSGFGVIIRYRSLDEIDELNLNEAEIYEEIFAHKSSLLCQESDLNAHRFVSFQIRQGKKRKEAFDLKVIEHETDVEVLTEFLKLNELDNDWECFDGDPGVHDAFDIARLKICCKYLPNEEHPLLHVLPTISGIDEISSPVAHFVWPDTWMSLPLNSEFLKFLPASYKKLRFNKEVSLRLLSGPVSYVLRDSQISKLGPQEKQLALSWCKEGTSYEQIKMLSARHAELKVGEFFSELGMTVLDIASHQVTGESEMWKTHDLLVESIPIDVKNARKTINGQTFVEYTVKRFKTDRFGQEVVIAGVLSPYLKETSLNSEFESRSQVIMLGTVKIKDIIALSEEFSKRELRVDFGDENRWPIWIFNNRLEWFETQHEALITFKNFACELGNDDWSWWETNLIPIWIASGLMPPSSQTKFLNSWQKWYLRKIVEKARTDRLTLPWLYLFTFSHFIEAITNIESAESQGYTPDGYNSVIFHSELDVLTRISKKFGRDGWKIALEIPEDRKRPAGLIDPLLVLDQLVFTLTLLWSRRKTANLGSLRKFTLKGEGLLRAINKEGSIVTVLAFCGGRVNGHVKCGNAPLIIGVNETCSICNMLICEKCGHCSNTCTKASAAEMNA